MTEKMENVAIEHRSGMGKYEYSLGWEVGEHRFHVWIDDAGQPGEHIYKNPIDRHGSRQATIRLFVSNRINQRRISQALVKLGKPLKEAMAEAVERERTREADRQAEKRQAAIDRARTAFSVALRDHPHIEEFFIHLPEDELLEISTKLWKGF